MKAEFNTPPCTLLALARTALGLTQEELAKKAGCSRIVVQNAEYGVRLQPVYAKSLLDALGMPLDDELIEELTSMQTGEWRVSIELVKREESVEAGAA